MINFEEIKKKLNQADRFCAFNSMRLTSIGECRAGRCVSFFLIQKVAGQTYGITSIPASFLVDPQGVIVAADLRGDKLGAKLKEIYGF